MITRAPASPLPIAWVTADFAHGQDSHLRRFLEDAGLSYVVAVPKSQQVHGPRIDYLIKQAPPEAWQRRSAGDGAKGERLYDWAAARLPAIWESDTGTSPSPCSPTRFWPFWPPRNEKRGWSRWRRRHQAHARRCHYMRRGHSRVGHQPQNRPAHVAASLNPPPPAR